MGRSGPSLGAAGPSGHPTSPGWDPDAPPEVDPAPAQPTPKPSAPTSPPAGVLRRKAQETHPQGGAPAKQAHKEVSPCVSSTDGHFSPLHPCRDGAMVCPVGTTLPAEGDQTSPPRTVPSSVSQSFQENQVRGWEGGGGGRPSAGAGNPARPALLSAPPWTPESNRRGP